MLIVSPLLVWISKWDVGGEIKLTARAQTHQSLSVPFSSLIIIFLLFLFLLFLLLHFHCVIILIPPSLL